MKQAGHDDVAHAADYFDGIFNRFLAAAHGRSAHVVINGVAAELGHADFKRQAGAQARLFKDHQQSFLLERLRILLRFGFYFSRQLQHGEDFRRTPVLKRDEMVHMFLSLQ